MISIKNLYFIVTLSCCFWVSSNAVADNPRKVKLYANLRLEHRKPNDQTIVCVKYSNVGRYATTKNDQTTSEKVREINDRAIHGTIKLLQGMKLDEKYTLCKDLSEKPGDNWGTIILSVINARSIVDIKFFKDSGNIEITAAYDKAIKEGIGIQLLGGDYHPGPLFMIPSASDTLVFSSLRLTPIKGRAKLQIPYHECPPPPLRNDDVWKHERKNISDKCQEIGGAFICRDIEIGLTPEGYTEKTEVILHNNCQFKLASGTKIAETLRLQTSKFTLLWTKDCLASKGCPKVVAVEDKYHCTNPDTEETQERLDTCRWVCEGEIPFPTRVQFRYHTNASSEQPGSVQQHENSAHQQVWEATVEYPGKKVSEFIGESQRALRIKWTGFKNSRAEDKGDKLKYVDIRTPEGRLHRMVIPIENRIDYLRIPELDCESRIGYRFIGTRAFKEETLDIKGEQETEIKAPTNWSDVRNDRFIVGGAIGGGIGEVLGKDSNNDDNSVSPAAEVAALFVWRGVFHEIGRGDVEFRTTAMLAPNEYCSNAGPVTSEEECIEEKFAYYRLLGESILIWAFDEFYLGLGQSAGLGIRAFSKDGKKTSNRFLYGGGLKAGYRINRTFGMELTARMLLGEVLFMKKFDEIGEFARQKDEVTTLFLSLVIRFDDFI